MIWKKKETVLSFRTTINGHTLVYTSCIAEFETDVAEGQQIKGIIKRVRQGQEITMGRIITS